MRIKLQVNGESSTGKEIEDLEKYGMNDSEYEVDMEISYANLIKLESFLDKAIENKGGELFNWHIVTKE